MNSWFMHMLYIFHERVDEEWLHTYYFLYMYNHISKIMISTSCETTIWTQGLEISSNKLGYLEVLESYGGFGIALMFTCLHLML